MWHIVLNNGLISDSEDEDQRQDACFETLDHEQQLEYQHENWERVFDVSHLDNGWITRGKWIQATFWELKKENVRKVRFFRTAHRKEEPHYVFHTATALRYREGTSLEVTFDDGLIKTYDVALMFGRSPFMKPLEDRELFITGKLSPGGYGIIWTDDLDLDVDVIYRDGALISDQ